MSWTLFTEAKADELIDVENEEKSREVKSEPQVTNIGPIFFVFWFFAKNKSINFFKIQTKYFIWQTLGLMALLWLILSHCWRKVKKKIQV